MKLALIIVFSCGDRQEGSTVKGSNKAIRNFLVIPLALFEGISVKTREKIGRMLVQQISRILRFCAQPFHVLNVTTVRLDVGLVRGLVNTRRKSA